MTEEALKKTIKELIVKELKLNREPDSISDTDNLFGGGLGLDSIDVLTLVSALEGQYDLNIDDDEVEKLNSVDSIAEFVNSKKN